MSWVSRRLSGATRSAWRAGTRVRVSWLGSKKRARAPSATTIRVRLWRGSMGGARGSFALRLGFITDLVIDRLLGSSEAALHPFFAQPLAQQADPVATPEQLAFENEGRHAKNARGLGFVAQVIVPATARARQERGGDGGAGGPRRP